MKFEVARSRNPCRHRVRRVANLGGSPREPRQLHKNSISFHLHIPPLPPSSMSIMAVSTSTFTHPPHPSEKHANTLSLNIQAPSSSPGPRDPHRLPSFDSKSLAELVTPVLYLPPLLSSLPSKYSPLALAQRNPPLITETRLPDIDPASLSLHKALHHFKPLTSDYADTPYSEAFNWSELTLPVNENREWYCVVFRSKRKAGSDGGCKFLPPLSFHQ